MSRAMNVDLPIQDVQTLCRKHRAEISVIETLPAGSTRLVLKNVAAATAMRKTLGKRVLSDHLTRTSLTPRRRASSIAS